MGWVLVAVVEAIDTMQLRVNMLLNAMKIATRRKRIPVKTLT